jgi:preprotein translocase subunit YajC
LKELWISDLKARGGHGWMREVRMGWAKLYRGETAKQSRGPFLRRRDKFFCLLSTVSFLLIFITPVFAQAPATSSVAAAPAATASSAVTAPAAAGAVTPFQFILGSVNFFLVGFFVYYLLILRPGQLKDEAHSRFLRELKKDTEVMTSGGLLGRVREITPQYIVVEVSGNVRLRVHPEHVGELPTAASPASAGESKTGGDNKAGKTIKERKAK